MKKRKPFILKSFSLLLLSGFFSTIYCGFSLNPLITVLEISKGKTSAEVLLKFEGDVKRPVAVELKVTEREISIDGEKVIHKENEEISRNFIIYPAQVVLMPGDNQRVQIKWVGNTIPKKEIAYGLIAEEVPVKIGDEDEKREKAELRLYLVARYEGIIVLRPSGIKPDLVVKSAVHKKDEEDNDRLVVNLNNKGTGLQNLKGLFLRVSSLDKNGQINRSKSMIYKPKLESKHIKHSVFAGYDRVLDLSWPEEIPAGPVRVSVEFEK
ncbi:MAG: molecular chaperone [Fibrobacter sp.]|nr:molecular chaperone [Fibrobacter sp.]